jgi:rare lipoprotein A
MIGMRKWSFVQYLVAMLILLCELTYSQNDSLYINKSAKGKASFYGPKFEGRKTYNGEIFSNFNLTAAHKTFPMNSIVRVTVVQNNRYIFVRVNDRGPFVKGRIIDLTDAGAVGLDFTHAGTEYVNVRLLEEIQLTPELRQRFNDVEFVHDCLGNTTTLKGKAVQVGAFLSIEHALYNACDLYNDKELNDIAIKVITVGKQKRYMVIIHNIKSEALCEDMIQIVYTRGMVNAKIYNY